MLVWLFFVKNAGASRGVCIICYRNEHLLLFRREMRVPIQTQNAPDAQQDAKTPLCKNARL